ncbi:conserved protein of unknown function [Pararobbsia alpina]|uniref:hypothetical protein n=1 Tax=Pararobbsia alpina TaxID=621374 RepID=UPI0039A4C960
MNTLKTTAARLSRLAPQGPLRWLKLSAYVFIFLLPFGMAMIALLVYLDRRNRAVSAPASRNAALPVPASSVTSAAVPKRAASARKIQRATLPKYCGNRP